MFTGCGIIARGGADALESARFIGQPGRHGRLSPEELTWAKTAWIYFVNNTNVQTGLVNSVDRYQAATMWHVGDYLAALVAARELGLIDVREFDVRVSKVLEFLNSMELSGGVVPNKVYNTQNGVMVNFANQPQDIGWSAVDLARLMTWMKITGERYPPLREYFDKVVLRWGFCDVIDRCGVLHGAARASGQTTTYQEGRLGYEQYSSTGFALWGFDARGSASVHSYAVENVFGIRLHHDSRDTRADGVQAPVLTIPHVLLGLEFGWVNPGPVEMRAADGGPTWKKLAEEVYQVQRRRYAQQGIYTARTDHQLSRPPYFLYDSIFAGGYPWNTVSDQGKQYDELALVATRAVFGMWALWPDAYSNRLIRVVNSLYDPQRGWYEGRFEATGALEPIITLSTNALVLEVLLFKSRGQLYHGDLPPGFFEHRLNDAFSRPHRCFPGEQPACE